MYDWLGTSDAALAAQSLFLHGIPRRVTCVSECRYILGNPHLFRKRQKDRFPGRGTRIR